MHLTPLRLLQVTSGIIHIHVKKRHSRCHMLRPINSGLQLVVLMILMVIEH
jgi:hypothetical protein